MRLLVEMGLVGGIGWLVGYSYGQAQGWSQGYQAGQRLIQQAQQVVRLVSPEDRVKNIR